MFKIQNSHSARICLSPILADCIKPALAFRRKYLTAAAPGGIILEISEAGGLLNYIRSTGDFPCTPDS